MKTNNGTGVGVKLVVFQLGVDLFAADVLAVDRVLRYSPPNSVPDVPAWVEGVIEHRGEVIPVVDLRRRIELAETTITPETRMLVLNTSTGWVGAIVDAVHEVAVVPIESMSPPPALFKGVAADVRARRSPRCAISSWWCSTWTACMCERRPHRGRAWSTGLGGRRRRTCG